MLSILIPIYNYDVTLLVHQLRQQAEQLPGPWEIRLLDDGSTGSQTVKNHELAQLPQVHYRVLKANVGRAKVRNLLAAEAQYPYLLFMDCDSGVTHNDYLACYWNNLQENTVLCGGRSYANAPATHEYRLHWWYGSQRETRTAQQRTLAPYEGFMTNNFVVPAKAMLQIPFDESIQGYGHEDTLFGWQLQVAGIAIKHLDNPLLHVGLDKNEAWLRKQQTAIANLHQLHSSFPQLSTRALRWWKRLRATGLMPLARPLFKGGAPIWEEQLLNRSRPALWQLDLLKIWWLELISD